jgi:hypothetical protein
MRRNVANKPKRIRRSEQEKQTPEKGREGLTSGRRTPQQRQSMAAVPASPSPTLSDHRASAPYVAARSSKTTVRGPHWISLARVGILRSWFGTSLRRTRVGKTRVALLVCVCDGGEDALIGRERGVAADTRGWR